MSSVTRQQFPQLSVIVAAAENGVIGHEGNMPWHQSADLAHFKRTTLGHPVLMGRKTFESLGRPLPGRQNIVISRNPNWATPQGVTLANSLEAAVQLAKSADGEASPFLIGGGELYALGLREGWVHRIFLTRIAAKPVGDTFFPVDYLQPLGFVQTAQAAHAADERNTYAYTFEVWEKA